MSRSFDSIKFVTNYGEKCIATKNNGVVTIKGDKNGVRQMPLDEFMKAFIRDQKKQGMVSMERSPEKDVVEFGRIR